MDRTNSAGGAPGAVVKNLGWYGAALAVMAACFAAIPAAHGADGRDALFEDDDPLPKPKSEKKTGGVTGYIQLEAARTVSSPDHWSKLRARGELASRGDLGGGIRYKLSARADYDAVYDINDFYPQPVRHDQRFEFALRENYLDISRGDWDFRLGRQHVVWGEMVGLFFADVVSARDLREFILPEFEALRTPQWAARAEYYKDDFHAEFLWVPVASYDKIGKPGAELYPYQPDLTGRVAYLHEKRPKADWDHMNYGVRLSALLSGWDLSGFAYSSMDVQPTFYRTIAPALPVPTVIYQARHERIRQFGGTLAKDIDGVVFKMEAVHTHGRKYPVLRFLDADGLAEQNTVDWAAGLDFTLPADTRFNVQFFQRIYTNHDRDSLQDREENGYSLYLNTKIIPAIESQVTYIASLNRSSWLARPRVLWNFQKNWRLLVGADVFGGKPTGLFGQYDERDRVYTEVRYTF